MTEKKGETTRTASKADQLKQLFSKMTEADYEAMVQVFQEQGALVNKAKAEAERRDKEAAEQAEFEQRLQAHKTVTEETVTAFAEKLAEQTFETSEDVREFVKLELLGKLERVPTKNGRTGSTGTGMVQTVREGSGNWLIREACKDGFTHVQDVLKHMVEGGVTAVRAKRLLRKALNGKLPIERKDETIHWIGE